MKPLYTYLAYAGTLPFIACAILLSMGVTVIPLVGETQRVLSAYSLAIVTFMAGSHWGQHLHIKTLWQHRLPILSNTFTVLIWIGFLVLSFELLVVAFIAAFLILLEIDRRLLLHQLITREYFRTRCFVTGIVVFMLMISVVSTWWRG